MTVCCSNACASVRVLSANVPVIGSTVSGGTVSRFVNSVRLIKIYSDWQGFPTTTQIVKYE